MFDVWLDNIDLYVFPLLKIKEKDTKEQRFRMNQQCSDDEIDWITIHFILFIIKRWHQLIASNRNYKTIRLTIDWIIASINHSCFNVEMKWVVVLLAITLLDIAVARPSKTSGVSLGDPAPPCDAAKCKLPDCRCSSSDIPGGLDVKQVPQVSLAVNCIWFGWYRRLTVLIAHVGGSYHLWRRGKCRKLCPIRAATLQSSQPERVPSQSHFLHFARVHRLHTGQWPL